MRRCANQLELPLTSTALEPSVRFECEHDFHTGINETHECCSKCGLLVPHEYIVEKLDVMDWGSDA